MRFYEDPSNLSSGRLPQRCYYIPGGKADCTVLNGQWNFCFFDDGDRAAEPQKWDTIDVPSCWQLRGYEHPNYANINYPFAYDPPFVPNVNPMGIYERVVDIHLDGRQHYLVMEGVASFAEVILNGSPVGCTDGSHLQSEFDLTPYAKEGANTLRIKVRKWCCGSYLEDQDCFRYNGIFRDIYILSRPQGHLIDFRVTADCQSVEVTLDRDAHITLTDGDCVIGTADGAHAHFTVSNPHLWNSEDPYLYTLKLECAGEIIEQTVGLRTVALSDSRELLINGSPVKLKGINHHDTDPNGGWCMTDGQILRDLKLIKSLNINTVRTSHYPPTPKFLEMCDRLGLYVILETDIETHGALRRKANVDYEFDVDDPAWPCTDPMWHDAFISRMERAFERDKNYSCVIAWSTGNESGHGPNHVAMIEWLRAHDSTRLIHCEDSARAEEMWYIRMKDAEQALDTAKRLGQGVEQAEDKARYTAERYAGALENCRRSDFYSRMYSPIADLMDWAAHPERISQPIFLCEYSHAMGLGPGDVHDYVEAFYSHPSIIGGCIWEWADHVVIENGVQRYGGDWNEMTHDSNFCCDGLVFADRSFKSGTMAVKTAYAPFRFSVAGENLIIENRCDFTDLNRFDFICTVSVDGKTTDRRHIQAAAAPHSTVSVPIELGLPDSCKLGAFINLTMVRDGEQLGTLQQPLDCPVVNDPPAATEATLKQDDRYIYAVGDGFVYRLNKATGSFDSMVIDGQEHLAAPVRLGAFRAVTDNDGRMAAKWAFVNIWEGENLDRTFTNVYSVTVDGGVITVSAALAGVSRMPVFRYTVRIRVLTDGTAEVSLDGHVNDHSVWLPRLGFEIDMPSDIDRFTYFGRGPMDNYCDMCHHAPMGMYSSTADAEYVPYVRPQEHGTHTGVKYVQIGKIAVTAENQMELNVSKYSIAQLYSATHTDQLGESTATHVRLDYRNSGVGSASCGPDLDERYRLSEKDIHFAFSVSPVR
ncbi:MAG: glycoside hydrolase family 2 TIM barrel-domain containing protein [Firmicutes bacterium]|nr:glycoside hydrolase family 2 TIM barrel-domain containing protein [Bacillota bacterium]